MPKFSIGDLVTRGKNNTGAVVAIFTTTDGEPRYAVENEGALQFVLEAELAPYRPHPRAA